MNILILSASTGGGHNRASNALKAYINTYDPDTDVQIVDTLNYCSKILNKTVTLGYKTLAQKAPDIYGFFYKKSDKPSAISDIVSTTVHQMSKKLLPLIDEKKPDIIVTCHPFACSMLSTLKSSYGIDVPVVSIITDYMPHRAYIGKNIDAYITAGKETSDNLIKKYGIEPSKVFGLGMPIYDGFYKSDEQQLQKTADELSFRRDIPTVLIMAGSFGVTDILKIYEKMVEIDVEYQIIVITGKNRKLYEAFEKLLNRDISEFETLDYPEQFSDYDSEIIDNAPEIIRDEINSVFKKTFKRSTNMTKPTKLFYFVDNVEDYMHYSDLIITKPGGLTTCESLACGLPMAVFQAIQGQESQNADLLTQKHAAVKLEKGSKGVSQIEYLLTHPEELEYMSKKCKALTQSNSTERIYNLMKDIIKHHNNNQV